ncbi:MAG: hypothetical protein Fur0022_46110 [Anaerolineales bacterium]
MNQRTFLSFSLISAIVAFSLVSLSALYHFLLPRPNPINLGPVTNYPPKDSPYFVRGDEPVFIVHTGEIFLVLVANPPHPKACQLRWLPEDSKFLDPCLGSQFYLDGTYLLGPSPRSMDQFEFQIIDGNLWVDFDRKILGAPHK